MMASIFSAKPERTDHPACRACKESRVIAAGPRVGDVECTAGKNMTDCQATRSKKAGTTFTPREPPASTSEPVALPSNSFNLSGGKDDLKIKSISPIEDKLLGVLKEGPLTRDQLVKKTGGIPRTTIYDGLKKLIVRNEVKKHPVFATDRSRGRPQVLFSLLDDRK